MKKLLLALCALCLTLLTLACACAETAPEMSTDLYSFQATINGELYAFPMTYADFVAKGWAYKDDETALLDPNYYSPSESFTMGDLRCYATITNFDISAQPMASCYVAGISIDTNDAKNAPDFALTLPGGAAFGKTTVEEAKTLYGTPSDVYEGSLYTKLTYRLASYCDIELEFDIDAGVLTSVDIRNMDTPADFVPSEVPQEVPAIVTAYKLPDTMSENLSDFTVTYGGVIYKLPVPVSVMVENGWAIVANDSDTFIAGHNSGWVTLMNNNQRLRVLARNYSHFATPVINGFVTELESNEQCQIDILTTKGLTVGMTEADLLAALDGLTVEKYEGSSYVNYSVAPGESSLDEYEVTVREGVVTGINVSYAPKYSDYMGE